MDKIQIKSSLRFFNFEGMSLEKVVEKYEEVLSAREKQITDLSHEIGLLNEKLSNCYEKNKLVEDENKLLHNKLLKKETILTQELTNKEIMFIRMQNLEKENDKLIQHIQGKGIDMSLKNSNLSKKFYKDIQEISSINKNSNFDDNKSKEKNGKSRLASEGVNYEPVFK